jgi:hypothetical protein
LALKEGRQRRRVKLMQISRDEVQEFDLWKKEQEINKTMFGPF